FSRDWSSDVCSSDLWCSTPSSPRPVRSWRRRTSSPSRCPPITEWAGAPRSLRFGDVDKARPRRAQPALGDDRALGGPGVLGIDEGGLQGPGVLTIPTGLDAEDAAGERVHRRLPATEVELVAAHVLAVGRLLLGLPGHH